MTGNSLNDLRARLLADEGVQQMIRVRAYEIFQMRGAQPGGPAQDWFQAESEVLAFLLAREPNQATEVKPAVTDAKSKAPPSKLKAKGTKKAASARKTASKKASTKRAAAQKAKQAKTKARQSAIETNPSEDAPAKKSGS